MSISKSTENAGWRMITTSVIGINQEKSTFFIHRSQLAIGKRKYRKKLEGVQGSTCVIAFREIGACNFSKIFMSIRIPDILRMNKKSSTSVGNSIIDVLS